MSWWHALVGLSGLALLPAALQGASGFKQDYLNELQYVSGNATALAGPCRPPGTDGARGRACVR